ncbi:DUF1877 domain-containing protein [Streptomyces sp. NPDC049097]|uniref:DUF1877 domain-containing protein n=1 Tax=Streptomyces sp. NPDC049097 TaxID=3155497 RepID=UPI003444118A
MAVTQQLARIPAEYLAACRQSAGASSDGDPRWDPPASDMLDLDWAPTMLGRLVEVSGLDEMRLDALRRATDGDAALYHGFLATHPHAIGPFGPAPTALSSAQVVHVSSYPTRSTCPLSWPPCPPDDREAWLRN